MSDARTRDLERRWKATGDELAELALLEHKARIGQLGGRPVWLEARGASAKLLHLWEPSVFDRVEDGIWPGVSVTFPGGLPLCRRALKRFPRHLDSFAAARLRRHKGPLARKLCQRCRRFAWGPQCEWPPHVRAEQVRLEELRATQRTEVSS